MPRGAGRAGRADCADAILAALDGLPPPRLLVNNASRFAYRQRRRLHRSSSGTRTRHQPARAGLAVPGLRGGAGGGGGLIVNLLDAKLAAAQPGFLHLHRLQDGPCRPDRAQRPRLMRARHPGLRIAPSVTLVSGPQSRDNFDKVHASTRWAAASRWRRSSPRCASSSPRRPDRPDHHARRRPALPVAAARRPIPGAAHERIPRLDGSCPRRCAPHPQDRARGLCAARRHRLPRFRGRQSAAADRHGRGVARRGSFAADDEAPSAWNYDFLRTEIGAARASRATISRRRWPARSTTWSRRGAA
jgi:hypothetical protein